MCIGPDATEALRDIPCFIGKENHLCTEPHLRLSDRIGGYRLDRAFGC
jgi:hypothetical protein